MAGAGTEADRGAAMIKLASPGEPPDLDGDVTEKGAFGYPETVILPAHDRSHVPLGRAKVNEAGDGVVADLKFHLDIPVAREWHRSVLFELENGPPTQQWSQGFMAPSSRPGTYDGKAVRCLKRVKVHEVNPVRPAPPGPQSRPEPRGPRPDRARPP